MIYVDYRCDICNFTTKNNTVYNTHCNTKKHIKNIKLLNKNNIKENKNRVFIYKNNKDTPNDDVIDKEKKIKENDENIDCNDLQLNLRKFKCNYCENNFTQSCNLMRHIKCCYKREEEINKLEEQLQKKNVELEKKDIETEVKLFQKDLEYEQQLRKKETERADICMRELEYYKSILNMAGGMVQKTVGALTFVVSTYDKAKPIEKINLCDIKTLRNIDDTKFIDQVFYHYNRNKLGQYIGDIIVEIYKKDNKDEQSIWNTDTSRLTYLLRQILFDNNSKWQVDKKGVNTIEYLITPIMDKIKVLAKEYQEANCFGKNLDTSKVVLINSIYVRLMADIDNRQLHSEVLKYISPHFYVNHKNLIEND